MYAKRSQREHGASEPANTGAIRIIAENKIRAAIEAGEFDNRAGPGKPAAIFDEPYDPHWWIRRKLKREQLLADQLSFYWPSTKPEAATL